uniref:NmrA-like domain-containing protein n=1 Tax=Porphyridium sordidum TaxID=28024 RepID=A0A1C9CDT7_PORSO|nr:hypothetical protein Psor_071 [Porphyridium sordidum]AOM66546.1 hypothetical protein Psor_071 [Porphyridium sordidum]
MTLLIIGATGTLGRQIARMALQEGYQVKCLVRNVRQASFLKEWGAQLVYGDLTIPETIPPCLLGVTAIIDASTVRPLDSYTAFEVDMEGKNALVQAAIAASVDRFIFFSLVNLEEYQSVPILTYKLHIEKKLQESGIKYTVFRLAGFYQGLISQYCVPILDQQPVWLTGESTPIAYMDTQDIAKFVLKSLSLPNTENKIINLTGTKAWISQEIIDICQILSGQKAKVNKVPLFLLNGLRKFTQFFEWTYNISDRLAFTEVLGGGKKLVAPMYDTYNMFNIKDQETVPLEKYLQEYFSKILKKLKELNQDQKQKYNNIQF